MTKELTPVFNGITIGFNGNQQVNLTNLWKASGKDKSYKPYQWLILPDAKRFIEALAAEKGGESSLSIENMPWPNI